MERQTNKQTNKSPNKTKQNKIMEGEGGWGRDVLQNHFDRVYISIHQSKWPRRWVIGQFERKEVQSVCILTDLRKHLTADSAKNSDRRQA